MKRYASFGLRFTAFFFDLIFVFLTIWLFYSVFDMGKESSVNIIIFSIFWITLFFFYFIFYPSRTGQTLGKKLIRIKVVNSQGKVPSLFTFLIRETIGRIISNLFMSLGYFWMLRDAKHQTWHDKIAGTYVIEMK